MSDVKKLVLDGLSWRTKDDFYDAFFKAVGAPKWHGRNFNAVRDSIVHGQINQLEIPYMIDIVRTGNIPADVKNLVKDFCSLVKELHAAGHNVDISCQSE